MTDKELDKLDLKQSIDMDYVFCVPSVCKKCKDLINNSDKSQDIFRCKHIGFDFHNMDSFQDMYVPEECKYKMEHIVIGKKAPFKKSFEDVCDEMEDQLIMKMEKERYGE